MLRFVAFCVLCVLSFSATLEYPHGKCKGLWRSDKLVGKCFGLSYYKHFLKENAEQLQHVKPHMIPEKVNSASECRALCCNIGLKCVTWQYQDVRDEPCKFGGPVRVGLESAGVASWCEPLPPASWSGYRLHRSKTAGGSSGKDVKGEDVPHQCFGLGPERLHPSTNKRLSVSECEATCVADPSCEIWQSIEGRGCFYNKNEGIHCGEKSEPPYAGGRKCIPGFCGSPQQEKAMLSRYNISI